MRRLFLAALLAGAALPAAAQEPPPLFKVISAKDEVVIGLAGATVESLARRLVDQGQVTAWQFAVRRGAATGASEYGPLRQVAILRQDTLRIEAYDPRPLKVAPLPP